MWPTNVSLSSIVAGNAKYAFLRTTQRKYARSVALIFVVIVLLFPVIVTALVTVALRLHEISTGKGVA